MSSSSPIEEPAWKKLSTEQLSRIDAERKEAEKKGELVIDPKGTYGIVCRACIKPNTLTVTFCTGCGFPASKWDIQRLPDNIFLLLVQGQDIGAKVHYRDNDFIVFDDKYGVSDNHLDVIPTTVYDDISVLGPEHIPLLESLYELGKKEFLRRNINWLQGEEESSIDDYISAGYNYPVSVKHLHLHMILPPFKHEKVLGYPRWHSHKKVIADLKTHGKVILFAQAPNEEEGKKEYDRAMQNMQKVKEKIAKIQNNNNNNNNNSNSS